MTKGVVCVALLALASAVTGWGQSQKPETLARWQFVGSAQLANEKDLAALREIISLPQSAELRDLALEMFASQVAGRFTKSNDTNANAAVAALVKPLLPDVLHYETRFEMHTRGDQSAEWLLALKLPPERRAAWSKSLQDLAGAARMRVSQVDNSEGWTAQAETYRVQFAPQKEWLLLQGGSGASPKGAKLPAKRGKELLNAEFNFPALAKVWDATRLAHMPKLTLSVAPRKKGVRSEMLIDYPHPLGITVERWNPPAELVFEPLIGFTALQGVGNRLGQYDWFKKLGPQKTPNQMFLWSQSSTPFTTYAAADVGNPAQVVSNLFYHILPAANLPGGKVVAATNRPAIVWRGLPVVAPFAEAAQSSGSPFLVTGLFPVSNENAKSAPKELFAQLRKRNLVYYDWEITSERLKQWRPIWQVAQIVQGNAFPPSVSDRWIEAVMPKLGNTITEVTLENPRRLKLVRQSESGLTALELVLLAHALDPNDIGRPPGGGQRQGLPAPVRR